jgi:hypothetical protein
MIVLAEVCQLADGPAGRWSAFCDDALDLVGHGCDEAEALADLTEQINAQYQNRVLH